MVASGRMFAIQEGMSIPFTELEFEYVRSAGPGGQNVNKVNSKAQLRWKVIANSSLPPAVLTRFKTQYRSKITLAGDVLLTSQRFRDQGRNTADVLQKLRLMVLAVAVAPKSRVATKPSKGSQRRRLQTKQHKAEKKASRRDGAWD